MGVIKHLMQEQGDDKTTPSHLEKEMYSELIKMRKQITAIQNILEECK